MSAETANAAPAPYGFSTDIFTNILMYMGVRENDPTFMWTTCREVSRHFKDAVERVFITRHLHRTFILFTAGDLDLSFEFSHLDPDNRMRAIFRETGVKPEDVTHKPTVIDKCLAYANRATTPRMYVGIRKHINDTPIPGVELNWETLELRCDWMKMYSEWYREQKEYHRRLHEFVDGLKVKILEMREQVDRGELDEMVLFNTMLEAWGDNYDKIWEGIRSERIMVNLRKRYAEEGQVLPKDRQVNDLSGFRKLKDVRLVNGCGGDSDDEEDKAERERDAKEKGGEDDHDDEEGEEDEEDDDDYDEEDDDGVSEQDDEEEAHS